MTTQRTIALFASTLGLATLSAAADLTLYDSQGFEFPAFSVGSVDAQNGWSTTNGNVPIVTNTIARSGEQSLFFASDPENNVTITETRIDHANNPQNPVVLMSFDVLMTQPGAGQQIGALFLDLSNQASGGNDSLNRIGNFAFTGPDGAAGGHDTGIVRLEYSQWSSIQIRVDLENRATTYTVDGSDPIDVPWSFPDIGNQYFGGFFFTPINTHAFGGQFAIDNLIVTAVPAPSSLALLGFAAIGARCRR